MHNTLIIAGHACMVFGSVLSCLAAYVLVRFRGGETRLIHSTKLLAAGTVLAIAGAVFAAGGTAVGAKALLCLLIALVTVPVETHALLRALRRTRRDVTAPGGRG